MGDAVEKVKKLVKAGSSIPGAIKECLPQSLRATALRYGRSYTAMSAVVNGRKAPSDGEVAVFVTELGGTDQEWRELLHEAGRPVAKAS